jgi:hypothetical protein
MFAHNWPRRRPARATVAAASLLIAGLLGATATVAARPGVFQGLIGTWSGDGKITLDNGRSESLKCKAYYTDKGDGLGIALRCASASNKIDLRATLVSSGSSVNGDWEERQFNAAGKVSGQASGNKITLSINGGGLTGSMAVTTSGSSQTVSITTDGSALKGVSIGLSRD